MRTHIYSYEFDTKGKIINSVLMHSHRISCERSRDVGANVGVMPKGRMREWFYGDLGVDKVLMRERTEIANEGAKIKCRR